MQTMPERAVACRGRSASIGALLAFGGGLALYQMTSLVLGPGGSRQLALSLSIPAVDVEELSQPVVSNVDLALGTRAAPAVPPLASRAASPRPPTRPKVRPTAPGPVGASPTADPEPPVLRPTPPIDPTQDPSRD